VPEANFPETIWVGTKTIFKLEKDQSRLIKYNHENICKEMLKPHRNGLTVISESNLL
jgi:hypothetical protein